MSRAAYYKRMNQLALEKRSEFGLSTASVGLRELRSIYRNLDIDIDLWDYPLKTLRGAYFDDAHGTTVMIAKRLPRDPRAFTMAHELKHHFVDRGQPLQCSAANQNELREIGAEVFAAEFLFPENMFLEMLEHLGVVSRRCMPADLVRLKRSSKTTLSYQGMQKRVLRLRLGLEDDFRGVKWRDLEDQIFGRPFHRRVKRSRGR